jgi:hypothetical protein
MKPINIKALKHGWKSTVMMLSTALCVGAMAPNAFAQGVHANADIGWNEVSAFDAFLDRHPIMADQLSANPGLVRNEEYLEQHPDLRNFLNGNPGVREEIAETPGRFMQREAEFRQIERTNGGVDRVELDNLDRYLDAHADVARELTATPGLADNREYLERHPELRVFLVNHPGVWSQFRAHPKWLMFRENESQSSEPADSFHGHAENDRDGTRNREQFWATHPEVARHIHANPALVRDPDTRAEARQDFHEYPINEPAVRAEITTHSSGTVVAHERIIDHRPDHQGNVQPR